jgi:hypothetical protein
MAAAGQAKSGGRQAGTPNRPKPAPPVTPAPAGAKFPKYRLERVENLTPDPRNPRTHTQADVDALAKNIGVNGWTNPIAVAGKECNILAGHRRRLAAIQRGMDVVPVIDLSHLKAKERLAYIVWDNQSTITGTWDVELLGDLIGELKVGGFDLDLTGLAPLQIGRLLGDPDPEPKPAKPAAAPPTHCPSCGRPFSAIAAERAGDAAQAAD